MKSLKYILPLWTLALGFPFLLKTYFAYSEEYLYPTIESHLPLLIPIAVLFSLRNFFTRFFLAIWILWLFIGETFILSYYEHNPYYIAQDEGCLIYSLFLTALSLGMFFNEKINLRHTYTSIQKGRNSTIEYDLSFLEYVFIAYPFIWIAIIYNTVGFIPLLAGKDITDNMYEINYGYIYGYGLYNCVSALIAYRKIRISENMASKIMWIVVLVLMIVIMSFDSKRLFLLLTLTAILVYEQIRSKQFRINRVTIMAGIMGVVLYSALQSIRIGNSDIDKYSSKGLPVGVEFREFIRTVNNHEPGTIENYDLFASTLAAMVNSSVIQFVGFDKSELIGYDSASAWMKLFDDNNSLGIRTGLISELYFAYAFYGLILMIAIGYGISMLCNALIRTYTFSNLALLAIIYGLSMLTIFGQLSVWSGCLTVLAYLKIALIVSRAVLQRGQTHKIMSPA